MRALKNLLLATVVCAMAGVSARAGTISLVFDSSTLIAAPGETVTVRGTFTNNDSAVFDLNVCTVTLPGPFSTDCSPFYSGPPSVSGGDSVTMDLFTFTPDVPFSGASGLQPAGSIEIAGGFEGPDGYDLNLQDVIVDTPFQVTVTPEPASVALFGLAMPLLYGLRRRR